MCIQDCNDTTVRVGVWIVPATRWYLYGLPYLVSVGASSGLERACLTDYTDLSEADEKSGQVDTSQHRKSHDVS
jgi:hypothetical protein